jgi:uncharacterized membrane protein (Fun14 family)
LVLPPSASVTFLAAAIGPLILGFIVGIIAKSAIKIGVSIAALIIVLIALGIIAPSQVLPPLLSIIKSGSALTSKVTQVAGYLPYSSVTFLIGLAVGFFKG